MAEAEEPSRERWQRLSAHAVCIDSRDRLLLCRLAPGYTRSHDGWWTLPGGGVDHGEHPRDAVLRELQEESGLRGEVETLLDVDSVRLAFEPWKEFPATDFHGVRIVYRVRVVGGELRPETSGSTDLCRWFTRAEAEREERLVDLVRAMLPHVWTEPADA